MSPINPVRDLAALVERQSSASAAAATVAELIADSDLNRDQLEKTLDSFRRALADHLKTQQESTSAVLCSFCHKSDAEVAALVVASSAAICDECTALSADVIAGRAQKATVRSKIGAVINLVRRTRRDS